MYYFKLLHTLDEVKPYWEKLSQNKYIYDSWEYQYLISREFSFELYCYIVFRDNILIGVLPFFLEPEKKYLFLSYPSGYVFSSLFSENEAFYYVLQQISFPYKIEQIIFEDCEKIPEGFLDAGTDSYYSMKLQKNLDLEAFLQQTFTSKNRCSIRNQFRKIEEQNIEIRVGKREDIQIAIKYNLERFGSESVFYNDPEYILAQNHLSTKENFWILSFLIGDSIKAVTYGIFLGNICYFLFSGSKNDDVPNIGKYSYMKTIEYAAKQGYEIFDAGFGDYNWKESWKFQKITTCNFVGNIGNNLLFSQK